MDVWEVKGEVKPLVDHPITGSKDKWRIRFVRNAGNATNRMMIDFQPADRLGKQAGERKKESERIRLGLSVVPFSRKKVTDRNLKHHCSDLQAGPYLQRVVHVAAGSVAEKAGIIKGDVILEFDGEPLRESDDLKRLTGAVALGDVVPVKLVRDGTLFLLDVKFETDNSE